VIDPVFSDLVAALNLVVLERQPGGAFQLAVGALPPAWFGHLFREAAHGQPITLTRVFPFLDTFLVEAERFWDAPRGNRLRSDPFVVADASGGELALAASAVAIGMRRFLIIEMPDDFDDRRRALQSAREHVLAHEQFVRRVSALVDPAADAARLTGQLLDSGLTPQQQPLAAGVRDQLAKVSDALRSLARGQI
jgi:hypothetical protein